MNYNSGNARRNFYAKWDKLREEYRAAGMKEDAIQKMYEYDLAVFNDDRAHHRYDVEIPSADDSENRNDYAVPKILPWQRNGRYRRKKTDMLMNMR